MQPGSKLFDDMSKLMTNAMGVAQGAKTEAETAMKGLIDRWMADRDFVTREEFDAVRAMAQKARDVLERAADQLGQHLPAGKRPPPSMVSAHIWAMSHGVVELFMRGAPGAKSPFPAEDLLEAGIGIYLRGLGLLPPDK